MRFGLGFFFYQLEEADSDCRLLGASLTSVQWEREREREKARLRERRGRGFTRRRALHSCTYLSLSLEAVIVLEGEQNSREQREPRATSVVAMLHAEISATGSGTQ